MFTQINNFITWFDGVVWGLPLIILILITGFLLTVRLGFLQVRHLGKALKFMVKNEEGGEGEVTSFGALCTALSATIGTGIRSPPAVQRRRPEWRARSSRTADRSLSLLISPVSNDRMMIIHHHTNKSQVGRSAD